MKNIFESHFCFASTGGDSYLTPYRRQAHTLQREIRAFEAHISKPFDNIFVDAYKDDSPYYHGENTIDGDDRDNEYIEWIQVWQKDNDGVYQEIKISGYEEYRDSDGFWQRDYVAQEPAKFQGTHDAPIFVIHRYCDCMVGYSDNAPNFRNLIVVLGDFLNCTKQAWNQNQDAHKAQNSPKRRG